MRRAGWLVTFAVHTEFDLALDALEICDDLLCCLIPVVWIFGQCLHDDPV